MKQIQLKSWIASEAQRTGKSLDAIWQRYCRGKYPWLKLRKINSRVVYVVLT